MRSPTVYGKKICDVAMHACPVYNGNLFCICQKSKSKLDKVHPTRSLQIIKLPSAIPQNTNRGINERLTDLYIYWWFTSSHLLALHCCFDSLIRMFWLIRICKRLIKIRRLKLSSWMHFPEAILIWFMWISCSREDKRPCFLCLPAIFACKGTF
jgi:hypothetical protein